MMEVNHSLISIIIPVYDRFEYLFEAIDSVIAQKYRPLEIIIIDDGSSQPMPSKIAKYVGLSSGVTFQFLSQAHLGPGAARNLGLDNARGEMIAFLDSDDLWYPEMLASTSDILITQPQIDLVCGGWDFINDDNQSITGTCIPTHFQKEADQDFLKSLLPQGLFPIHAVLCRKEVFAGIRFNQNLPAFEDWELWIRLASQKKSIRYIPVPVAHWRRSSSTRRSDIRNIPQQSIDAIVTAIYSNPLIQQSYANMENTTRSRLWLQQGLYYYQREWLYEANICLQEISTLIKLHLLSDPDLEYLEMATHNLQWAKEFHHQVLLSMSPTAIKRSKIRRLKKELGIYRKQHRIAQFIVTLVQLFILTPNLFVSRKKYSLRKIFS